MTLYTKTAPTTVLSITRPKRCLATSSAAAVSTEAKTLTSIYSLQSMGSSSRRRVWSSVGPHRPVGQHMGGSKNCTAVFPAAGAVAGSVGV